MVMEQPQNWVADHEHEMVEGREIWWEQMQQTPKEEQKQDEDAKFVIKTEIHRSSKIADVSSLKKSLV